MRPIGKDITKHYQIACSSMSDTLFAFYRLMFVTCLLFLFLRLFCYMCVRVNNIEKIVPKHTYQYLLLLNCR